MADVVDRKTRSRMMAGIRGSNTQPEWQIRRGLHAAGYRYLLHDRRLPGRPDLVFPSRRAVILIHGCFWHGHGCRLFKWPSSRPEWWREKIRGNRRRDRRAHRLLLRDGWRVLVIWECALKGPDRLPFDQLIRLTMRWLDGRTPELELRGKKALRARRRS